MAMENLFGSGSPASGRWIARNANCLDMIRSSGNLVISPSYSYTEHVVTVLLDGLPIHTISLLCEIRPIIKSPFPYWMEN